MLLQDEMPFEVLISEDGAKDATRKLVEEYRSKSDFKLTHITTPKDGFRLSLLRNRGAAAASGEVFLFSDGDLLLHPKFFEDFGSVSKKGIAFIGTRTFLRKDKSLQLLEKGELKSKIPVAWCEKNKLNALRIPGAYKMIQPYTSLPNLRGGLISVHRDDYAALNGYDERYVGWGREDADFVVRLFHHGVTIRKLKFMGLTSHLWHNFEARTSLSDNEALYQATINNPIVYCERGWDQHQNTTE